MSSSRNTLYKLTSVTAESDELTEDVLTEIAEATYPTLKRLTQLYDTQEPFPSHCFIYGVHTSRRSVSIIAHFPSGDQHEEFCQVLLARFHITYFNASNDQDDLLLQRWRLFTALCTVLRHTEMLANMTKESVTEYTERLSTRRVIHHRTSLGR